MQKAKKNTYSKTEAERIEELTGEVASLSTEAEELRKQIHRLKLEKDALEMAAEVIKKTRASVVKHSQIGRRL